MDILMALVGRCYQVDAAAVGATCDLSLSLQANRRLLADNDRQASPRLLADHNRQANRTVESQS